MIAEKHNLAPTAPSVPTAAVNDGRFSTQYAATEGSFSAQCNDGRFSTQYQQYDPTAPASARPMSYAYTDSTGPLSPPIPGLSQLASTMISPHASIYSLSALGAE